MRKALMMLAGLILGASPLSGHSAETANPQTAVASRIENHNRHDLKGFLQAHAENVEIYSYPQRLLGTGRAHLRNVLAGRFNDRTVQVEVLSQLGLGRFVVSDEVIREKASNGQVEHYIAIYEVVDDQIVSLRLIEQR
jgi:hypothetical protein